MLGKLKKRKRLRVHGFLKRSSTVSGKNVLKNRRRRKLVTSNPVRSLRKSPKKMILMILMIVMMTLTSQRLAKREKRKRADQ